jgi:rod shape determining protein RodA
VTRVPTEPGPLSAANRAAPPRAEAPPQPIIIPAARWARAILGEDATLKHFAWLSLLAALVLTLLGIYAIDIASAAQAGGPWSRRALTQWVYFAVALLGGAVALWFPPRLVARLAWPALLVCVGLLIFLLIPQVPASIVRPRNGCRGWIDLGPFDLQPSEVTKIAFVLAAAAYLRYRRNHRTVRGLLPPALITAVPVGLIMLQPDLGMALLFLPAIFAILLAAGARLKHLSIVVLAGVLAVPAAYPLLKPYQQQRILALFSSPTPTNPTTPPPPNTPTTPNTSTPSNTPPPPVDSQSFQTQAATTLIATGGLTGLPDAKARVIVQASRLPERHNDMVFSVIAARFGLLGGLAVVALYLLWLAGALLTAALAHDPFSRLMCVGFAAFVAGQALINIGMNLGILPIVGITLPFLSHGGSSLIVLWAMTGLILGAASRRPPRLGRPAFDFDRWE